MRQNSNDKLVARTAIQNSYEASNGDKGPEALVRFAFTVEKNLHDAGFEIVRKPQPASGPIMVSRVTHEDGSVTERQFVRLEPVRLEAGRLEPTETEKAAGWASVLIAKILEDGTARQAEAGVDVAAEEALARLRRDRGRMAFEDIDRNPPVAAGASCELLASWVRSLGDVNWCEVRLMPRRVVLTAALRGFPSQEQQDDFDRRIRLIYGMKGVVGVVGRFAGADAPVTVEIRFDHYITTVGCTFAPLDLPARPAKAAA